MPGFENIYRQCLCGVSRFLVGLGVDRVWGTAIPSDGAVARRKAFLSFRLRLHSGVTTHASRERSLGAPVLRQSGKERLLRCWYLGLRPRLVYVGPSALWIGGALVPGALPQAVMDWAFGPWRSRVLLLQVVPRRAVGTRKSWASGRGMDLGCNYSRGGQRELKGCGARVEDVRLGGPRLKPWGT